MFDDSHATLIVRPYESLPDFASSTDWSLWSKSSIASLTAIQISRMDNRTLEEIVELVQHELPHTLFQDRLQLCDRSTLERLTYLARCVCRNQVN